MTFPFECTLIYIYYFKKYILLICAFSITYRHWRWCSTPTKLITVIFSPWDTTSKFEIQDTKILTTKTTDRNELETKIHWLLFFHSKLLLFPGTNERANNQTQGTVPVPGNSYSRGHVSGKPVKALQDSCRTYLSSANTRLLSLYLLVLWKATVLLILIFLQFISFNGGDLSDIHDFSFSCVCQNVWVVIDFQVQSTGKLTK